MKRVGTASWLGYSLKKAKAELLKAEKNMRQKNKVLRIAQAEAGTATTDYKKAVLRYRQLENGSDED